MMFGENGQLHVKESNQTAFSYHEVLVALSYLTLMIPWTVAHQALLSWNSLGKNTGVSSHFLLQGIFLTQGLNPGLLHCRQILYHLSHQGSP